MACRSRSRAASAAHDIIEETGNKNVEVRELDLARLASVRAFAEGFNGPRERVDVLINNAGAMFGARELTPDGFEATWQVGRTTTPRNEHRVKVQLASRKETIVFLPPSSTQNLRRLN